MTIIDVEPTQVEIDGKRRKPRSSKKRKRVEPTPTLIDLFTSQTRTAMAMADFGEAIIHNAPGLIVGACLSLWLGGLPNEKNR